MVSLHQIIQALISLGVSKDLAEAAIVKLEELLTELDEVEVKGRTRVDTLLGCMMAIEAIIGRDDNG